MESFILRFLLVAYSTVALVITIFYLYYRRVTPGEYVLWGIIAFILPIVGPFFVIAARPGPRKRIRAASKVPKAASKQRVL